MSRFQQGSLSKMKRKGCPDVWVFRWYDNAAGTRTYKKRTVGSVVEMPARRDAGKAVASLRTNINAETRTPERASDLMTHYRMPTAGRRSTSIRGPFLSRSGKRIPGWWKCLFR